MKLKAQCIRLMKNIGYNPKLDISDQLNLYSESDIKLDSCSCQNSELEWYVKLSKDIHRVTLSEYSTLPRGTRLKSIDFRRSSIKVGLSSKQCSQWTLLICTIRQIRSLEWDCLVGRGREIGRGWYDGMEGGDQLQELESWNWALMYKALSALVLAYFTAYWACLC